MADRSPRPRREAQVPNGAADIARRFGVTIKALRLYRSLGLLKPGRTANGWRTYGREDCERLHRIVSLRQLGLPLATIAELFFGKGGQALIETLLMQEEALLEQRAKADEALAIVRRARARIEAGDPLDGDALAELVRRVNAAKFRWTPQLQAHADRTLQAGQRQRLADNSTPETRVQWAEFYTELAQLTTIGDPVSPTAQAMGRRAFAMIHRMTGGDPETWQAAANFWRDGLAKPELARDMPMTPQQWAFLGMVMSKLAIGRAPQ